MLSFVFKMQKIDTMAEGDRSLSCRGTLCPKFPWGQIVAFASASNVRCVLALPSSAQCDYNTQLSLHTLTKPLDLLPSQSQPRIPFFRVSTGLEAAQTIPYVLTHGDLIDCDPSPSSTRT
ncbi:hypothetical protein K503DRAFT_621932 [Rhizopogon vinicolor AM-OR11-026]|uniref:Uncharacterized protein n=1 Tax=Rhizopogon vinicolor AM-OR11-026 TaxID=1314800 RepID=A0A1B7MI83_9AGAM|nr:hypothetical protein K503DRAFT_621932 [Rhizopogon vinicolor AM-OR11-026]